MQRIGAACSLLAQREGAHWTALRRGSQSRVPMSEPTMSLLEDFLAALRAHGCDPRPAGDGKYSARCPSHDDHDPSLSVGAGDDGRILVRCHTGCKTEAVVAALGKTMRDLFSVKAATPIRRQRASETRFLIRDAAGAVQAIKVRVDYVGGGKECHWQKPDGTPGLGGRKLGSLPLYGSERLADIPPGSTVYLVEGEKKRDALEAAGFTAFGTVTGASGTPDPDVLRELLPFDVVEWPDADGVGHSHMARCAAILRSMGGKPRRLTWGTMGTGEDAADFLARGGTAAQLHAMTAEAQPYSDEAPAAEDARADIVCLADVEAREVRYLWRPYLPLGKVTLMDGDPGTGKTYLAAVVAAVRSVGGRLPEEDDTAPREPVTTIYVGCEDDPADTLRPRAEGAGADLFRVHVLRGRRDDDGHVLPVDLLDLSFYASIVRAKGARLLVIDPIQAYMPRGSSMNDMTDVRVLMSGLASLAAELDIAILVIRHLRKSGSARAIYAGSGSVDYVAAARSVLMVGKDPEREGFRVLAHAKSSGGPLGPSLAFEIVDGQFFWRGRSSVSADDLTRDPETKGEAPSDDAAAFLRAELSAGPVRAADLRKRADSAGMAWRTLERAKKRVGVITRHVGGPGEGGYWTWELPDAPEGGSDV